MRIVESLQSMLDRLARDLGCETHADLARALERDGGTISKWYSGKSNPRRASLAKDIERVGLDPADYGLAQPGRTPTTNSAPPAWAIEHHEQLMRRLRELQASIDAIGKVG